MPEATSSGPHTRGRVLLAAPHGWCSGVDRAVLAVEKALELYGPPIYVRHEIVHNTHVVKTLRDKGAVFVEDTAEVPENSIMMFSAHGVAPAARKQAAERGLATIDATCPLVAKVHKEARRYAREGYDVLLIGHEGHQEVIGTIGEAPDRITVVGGADDADRITVRDPAKTIWLSQTTLSVDQVMQTAGALRRRFPQLVSPPGDDICYATQNRQAAVRQIAPMADLVIVVGSPNSSNSQRLAEVARLAGAPAAYLVDTADQIDPAWLEHATTVGLTSGASAPEILLDGVLRWLAERGYLDVETVTAATESITFSLPRELRRDLRAELVSRAAPSADDHARRADPRPAVPPVSRPVRAVVCDIDHTLTAIGSPAALTRALGVPAGAHAAFLRDWLAGMFDDQAARARLLSLWRATGKANRPTFTACFQNIPLRPGARELAAVLRSHRVPLCLITSSAQEFADIMTDRLGASCGYGNGTLSYDQTGQLRSLSFTLDTEQLKVRHLSMFAAEYGLDPHEVIAVGNGRNDLGLFNATARGILLITPSTRDLAQHAWATAQTLQDAIGLITAQLAGRSLPDRPSRPRTRGRNAP
jgi:4-hydroxy-3-methylbut-2-en-1-yl diphosphate reductase